MLEPYKSGVISMRMRANKIKIINETSQVILLLIAPDPNQVVLMENGRGVSAGMDGAGLHFHAASQFVPRDGKTTKKSVPSGAVEELRMSSPKVFVTVLSEDSLNAYDTDIMMEKSDTLRVYASAAQRTQANVLQF
jgi:hypothetical protein